MNGTLEIFNSTIDYEDLEPSCGDYEVYTPARFLFITGASVLAGIGMVFNAFLVYFFATQKLSNTPPTLYPSVLAILDFCLCFMYIAIMGADAIAFYKQNEEIFYLYHVYIIPAFVLVKVTQMAIPYMLIFGTLERLVWTSGGMQKEPYFKVNVQPRRPLLDSDFVVGHFCSIEITYLLGNGNSALSKLRQHFEFRSMVTATADWVFESNVYHIYDFHFLVIAQTFIPFCVLIVLNFMVIKRLASVRTSTDLDSARPSTCSAQIQVASPLLLGTDSPTTPLNFDQPCKMDKRYSMTTHQYDVSTIVSMRSMSKKTGSAVKAAVYTMLGIVTSYLVSNSLHLFLTILERSKAAILVDPNDPNLASAFHTAFSDIVSFVYMLTSAMRLLIYMLCNPAIRQSVFEMLNSFIRPFKQLTEKWPQQNGTSSIML
ncbi:G-PROTEIN-RECEP-F1-2 domain-containing protein [Aphelenchoides bicaudatus]|nr:G-PROTEIN-RECEP-F1-2 domain-containing protein [Aphelenchoides bicaudatus]